MLATRSIKEKIWAIIFVIILFLLVGIIFGSISLANKKATEKLRAEVKAAKIAREFKLNFSKLSFNPNFAGTSARAYVLFATSTNGQNLFLTEKNIDVTLPIASITKLMTAIVVQDNVDLNTVIEATPEYVGGDSTANVLEIGHKYRVAELLNNMLISSDNDSARLLSSVTGEARFVELMNEKAKEIGLVRTKYTNVTGLDPLDGKGGVNLSSASDLVNLLVYINNNHRQIFQFGKNPAKNICDVDKNCKPVLTTNLFYNDKTFPFKIIGFKTGRTDLALKNLALITEPFDGIFLISIVLGSEDNFADTRALISNLKTN
jgi:D-alanyl-D-alanine carboxypeptidase (penicillin-binding protein 5/6)